MPRLETSSTVAMMMMMIVLAKCRRSTGMIRLYSSKMFSSHPNNNNKFAASRIGLDPALNRYHAPIVYHEHYSFADWPPNHTFSMDKFRCMAHAVMTTKVGTTSTVIQLQPKNNNFLLEQFSKTLFMVASFCYVLGVAAVGLNHPLRGTKYMWISLFAAFLSESTSAMAKLTLYCKACMMYLSSRSPSGTPTS